jgi:hypothetical protein
VYDIIQENNIDIFCVGETKIDSSFPDNQFTISQYNMYRTDRTNKGGGVMCFVRSIIPHRPRSDLSINKHNMESIVIDVRDPSRRSFIICMYRSPSTSPTYLCEYLNSVFEKCYAEGDIIYLIGDLNVNFIHKKHELTDLLNSFGMSNIIKGPTCFKNIEKPSLLDVIITNKPKSIASHLNYNVGISDCHNMICAATKMNAPRQTVTKVNYRSYKKFNQENFIYDVDHLINGSNEMHSNKDMETFLYDFKNIINKHAPLKTKYLKSKQAPYMNNKLRKAINVRGMLKRKYIRSPSNDTWEMYRRQRNYVTNIKRQSIKQYFHDKCKNFDTTTNTKSFWDTIKPFFSRKSTCQGQTINLLHNDKVVTNTREVCEIFNTFFASFGGQTAQKQNESVEQILSSFNNHESIQNIKQQGHCSGTFSFRPVSESEMLSKLLKLNIKKACGYDEIPAKLLKMAAVPLSKFFSSVFNDSLTQNTFPDEMKYANVSPVFKKEDNLIKENFRPISVLTSSSKIFESLIADQMLNHFDQILSKLLAAYRKRYSCENVILMFVEFLRKSLDSDKHAACILMDLSKAFDCLPHDLLIAKLHAYGVSLSGCKYILSYISNRKQRVKLGKHYSEWTEVNIGVPQGSILGPLLFNIFINDIFISMEPEVKLFNYADDNTLVYAHKDKDILKGMLEYSAQEAVKWFQINKMKVNTDKFQSMYLNKHNNDTLSFKVGNSNITSESHVKLLGINIDNSLNFDYHVDYVCKKAGKQINAIKRLTNLLDVESKLKIFNSYVYSNFNYCPTVYNTFSTKQTKKLEKLYERGLRFVFNDFDSPYKDILQRNKGKHLALTHLHQLVEQVYKIINNIAPPFSTDVFTKATCNIHTRNVHRLIPPKFNTIKYGKNSFYYRGACLWNHLPSNIKLSTSLKQFKKNVKEWTGPKCVCKNCFYCNIKVR